MAVLCCAMAVLCCGVLCCVLCYGCAVLRCAVLCTVLWLCCTAVCSVGSSRARWSRSRCSCGASCVWARPPRGPRASGRSAAPRPATSRCCCSTRPSLCTPPLRSALSFPPVSRSFFSFACFPSSCLPFFLPPLFFFLLSFFLSVPSFSFFSSSLFPSLSFFLLPPFPLRVSHLRCVCGIRCRLCLCRPQSRLRPRRARPRPPAFSVEHRASSAVRGTSPRRSLRFVLSIHRSLMARLCVLAADADDR